MMGVSLVLSLRSRFAPQHVPRPSTFCRSPMPSSCTAIGSNQNASKENRHTEAVTHPQAHAPEHRPYPDAQTPRSVYYCWCPLLVAAADEGSADHPNTARSAASGPAYPKWGCSVRPGPPDYTASRKVQRQCRRGTIPKTAAANALVPDPNVQRQRRPR